MSTATTSAHPSNGPKTPSASRLDGVWVVSIAKWLARTSNRCFGSIHLTNLLLIVVLVMACAMGGLLVYHVTLLQNIYANNADLTKSVRTLAAIEALRLYQSGISPEAISLMLNTEDEHAASPAAAPTPAGSAPAAGKRP